MQLKEILMLKIIDISYCSSLGRKILNLALDRRPVFCQNSLAYRSQTTKSLLAKLKRMLKACKTAWDCYKESRLLHATRRERRNMNDSCFSCYLLRTKIDGCLCYWAVPVQISYGKIKYLNAVLHKKLWAHCLS